MELKDWFIWNGTKCTDYGMHVLSQPSIISPKERVSYETIPGKSGSITLLEGDGIYDDINLSAGCVIDDPYMLENGESVSRIAKICGWLKGGGTVKFASRPEGYYRARVANLSRLTKLCEGILTDHSPWNFKPSRFYIWTAAMQSRPLPQRA